MIGSRIEVLFDTGKASKEVDLYGGVVGEHVNGQIYEVLFDDVTRAKIDLSDESTDWWRRERPEEPEEMRRAAAKAAKKELAARDNYVGVRQERDANVRAHAELLDERASNAARLEALLHRGSPPVRLEVPANAPRGLALSSGLVVFDPTNETTPLHAEHTVEEWAKGRAEMLAVTEPGEWAVEVLPFDLDEREQLRLETGLVCMSGHLDQTGAGVGRVRVLFDEFVFLHAPPTVVCPVAGGGALAVGRRLATEAVFAPGEGAVRVVATKLSDAAETAHDVGAAGALRAGNVFVFERHMPQPGRVGDLGPAVEVATGFEGWRISAALRPARQAHGNALLSAADGAGRRTARCVFYTTGREAASVRRTRALPVRDRGALAAVLEGDMQTLAAIEPRQPTPSELVSALRGAILGEDEFSHTDGATGGRIVNLGLRERGQASDERVESNIDSASGFFPIRLRIIHTQENAERAAALTSTVAPFMGAVAEDLSATWPTMLAAQAALLSSPAYPDGAFFPPARLQQAEGGTCLEVAEVGVRFTEAPALDDATETELLQTLSALSQCEIAEALEAGEASLLPAGVRDALRLLQQPCGVHSDKCDADVYEIISYTHEKPREESQAGGRLVMQLRLCGGAITRAQKKKKKTSNR